MQETLINDLKERYDNYCEKEFIGRATFSVYSYRDPDFDTWCDNNCINFKEWIVDNCCELEEDFGEVIYSLVGEDD